MVAAAALMSGAALGAGLSGCSAPPPPIALHNLERPTDMVFACVGLTGDASDAQVSGRPMSDCHVPGRFDVPPDLAHRTFGFVPNTARGELSVINLDTSKLVDLDPANPGTNVAPLGVLPEQISASDDGCRIVSANRGSCDLTVVDISALVAPALARDGKVTAPASRPVGQQVVVRTASGKPLKVAPFEAWFLPQDTSAIGGGQNACGPRPFADPIGWNAHPTSPVETEWKALVSFPSCNLVAMVNLPSGDIVDSVQAVPSSDGTTVDLVATGAEPSCPETDFCDGSVPPDSAGAPDGGALPPATNPDQDPFVNPAGTRPGPMVIRPTATRVYVGFGQAAFVAALDIQPGKLVKPAVGQTIQLHDHALGVNRVRLSVDPYKATGIAGQHGAFVGEGELRDRQYLYVIARDGTLRIVDVSRSGRGLPEIECDANIDPAKFPPAQRAGDPRAACWPADPPDPDHRRPLAQGPGIRFPGNLVPRDVAAVDLASPDPRSDWEGVLDGVYAFVLTSNGAVFVVNIDPTLRVKTPISGTASPSPLPEEEPLVNSLRDRNVLTYNTSLDPTVGPPRVDLPPTVPTLGPAILPINSSSAKDNVLMGDCTLPDGEGCTKGSPTYAFFPERSTVQRQTWNLTWEGEVLGPSFSGQFKVSGTPVAGGPQRLLLTDLGANFCASGVVPGDFVSLFGCTANNQCGPAQVCVRSETAPETVGTLPINGLCMLTDPKLQAQQLAACAPLLESVRRYEIAEATATTLVLAPKFDEVVSESLATCSDPVNLHKRCGPSTDPVRKEFRCEEVEGNARCLQPCRDGDPSVPACRSGRACVAGFCADAPPVPDPALDPGRFAACINQLTAYRVGAGSSFLVKGTAPSVFIPGSTNPDGTCRANPARQDRIPIFQTVGGVRTPLPLCDLEGDQEFYHSGTDVDAGADAGTSIKTINERFLSWMTNSPLLSKIKGAPLAELPPPLPCLVRELASADGDAGTGTGAGGSGGGTDGGTDADGSADDTPVQRKYLAYYALFENRELRFVLANLEAYLGDSALITFDVHGGFQPDTVLIPGSVRLDAPARLVLSPIDAQGQAADLSATHELPFMFVVDQRRLATASIGISGTRGQVLRIYSRKVTTSDVNSLLPVYDDLTSSGGLWPVQ